MVKGIMQQYLDYVIINPYKDNEWFKQWPKGEDMQLKLMCIAPSENHCFFFPANYSITTTLEDRMGHPMHEYSIPFSSIDELKSEIDRWAPIDMKQRKFRREYLGIPPLIKLELKATDEII